MHHVGRKWSLGCVGILVPFRPFDFDRVTVSIELGALGGGFLRHTDAYQRRLYEKSQRRARRKSKRVDRVGLCV